MFASLLTCSWLGCIQIGSTVDYQLRFEKLGSGKVRERGGEGKDVTRGKVREDRLFNTEQRLNAYAKRTVRSW